MSYFRSLGFSRLGQGNELRPLPPRGYDCSDPNFAQKERDRYNQWLVQNKDYLKKQKEKESAPASITVTDEDINRLIRALKQLKRLQDQNAYHGLQLYSGAYVALLFEATAYGMTWDPGYIKRVEDLLHDLEVAYGQEQTALKEGDEFGVAQAEERINRIKAFLATLLVGDIEGFNQALYESMLAVASQYLGAIVALGGGIAVAGVTSLLSTYLPQAIALRNLPKSTVPTNSPGAQPADRPLAPITRPIVESEPTLLTPAEAEAVAQESLPWGGAGLAPPELMEAINAAVRRLFRFIPSEGKYLPLTAEPTPLIMNGLSRQIRENKIVLSSGKITSEERLSVEKENAALSKARFLQMVP